MRARPRSSRSARSQRRRPDEAAKPQATDPQSPISLAAARRSPALRPNRTTALHGRQARQTDGGGQIRWASGTGQQRSHARKPSRPFERPTRHLVMHQPPRRHLNQVSARSHWTLVRVSQHMLLAKCPAAGGAASWARLKTSNTASAIWLAKSTLRSLRSSLDLNLNSRSSLLRPQADFTGSSLMCSQMEVGSPPCVSACGPRPSQQQPSL